GPFTFCSARSVLTVGMLALMTPLTDRIIGCGPLPGGASRWTDPDLWKAGFVCGLFLWGGMVMQQFGVEHTSISKAGFITGLYIVLVPVAALFLGRGCGANVWAALAIAVAGLYLLCMKDDDWTLEIGDAYVLAGTMCWTAQILFIDRFLAKDIDCVRFNCVQFMTAFAASTAAALAFEGIAPEAVADCAGPILYAGLVSGGVGYTLQVAGQKDLNPTVASLIMSLEAVVSAVCGWLFLEEVLTAREFAGCLAMGAAIVLAQLPAGLFARKPR
ncbi:MAG: DMT family transporter, partial [Duodenibacillus sp.]|nr:DMT family transporter [Duodenibacillus sp.]